MMAGGAVAAFKLVRGLSRLSVLILPSDPSVTRHHALPATRIQRLWRRGTSSCPFSRFARTLPAKRVMVHYMGKSGSQRPDLRVPGL